MKHNKLMILGLVIGLLICTGILGSVTSPKITNNSTATEQTNQTTISPVKIFQMAHPNISVVPTATLSAILTPTIQTVTIPTATVSATPTIAPSTRFDARRASSGSTILTPSPTTVQPSATPTPAYSTNNSAGSSAQCNDGTQDESGICAHHGV